MRRAVGMPDLHPGKGAPIGAVFATDGWVYPYLIGNDIGCGLALWQTNLSRGALKLDRWERRLVDLDDAWSGSTAAWLAERDTAPSLDDDALGTIGLGNHFLELQTVEHVDVPKPRQRSGWTSNERVCPTAATNRPSTSPATTTPFSGRKPTAA